ncbi:hypothetical protein RB195_007090 [Necator americanus]|uniref:Uncharacterized protein n=1 Tax=Necator americanus TaxID=51031 RepID=A0ABR1BYQ1_NECAM
MTRGTGLDFSTMYYEDPFRVGRTVLFVTIFNRLSTTLNPKSRYGVIRRKWIPEQSEYTPPKNCYAPGSWIANEGLYLLDPDTKQFYLTYYNIFDAAVIT